MRQPFHPIAHTYLPLQFTVAVVGGRLVLEVRPVAAGEQAAQAAAASVQRASGRKRTLTPKMAAARDAEAAKRKRDSSPGSTV